MVKQKVIVEPEWDSQTLKRWLDTIMNPGTKRVYKSAFRSYASFTGMTAEQLIDEALEDARKDPREKRDVVLVRLVGFYKWLKTERIKMSGGKGEHAVIGKGVSDKLAHVYVNSVRSFYATFDVVVRMRGRHRLPKPRVENKRMKVVAEQVKVLVDHARKLRDRAIILTLFQSGMDVSTLCSLKYENVVEGLANNEYPLKLELYRQKSGTDFHTFIGKDAIEAIKAYLADMKARGVQFRHDTPLFLKERGKEVLTTNLVQNMMRDLAVRSGFVDKENNGKAFNQLGPHALRESFGSIMINSGVPDTVVDFWLGHSIGEMAEDYKGVQFESLERMYLEREHLLSISTKRLDEKEFDAKVSAKVDERVEALRRIIRRYDDENVELRRRIQQTEEKLSEIDRKFAELNKTLAELQVDS
ncbi:MAG: tyrosine-type recombinase/integrase [Candidatus Bathyarchaeota archaeon]|nr:tyrosine-type recombinase/integrase [Candidatus Bathyarchaeota archaeon]